MENSPNTQGKYEHHLTFFRAFGWALCIGAVLLLALVAPFLLGKYCSHGWGLVAAIADIVGWLYLNQKYFGKNRMALSTRIIWLMGFAYIVFAAVFEFTHLPH